MLATAGWTPAIEEEFTASFGADGLEPGRVAVEHRGAYLLYTGRGERPAELSGRLRHAASSRADLPAVGDWVAVAGLGRRRPGARPGRAPAADEVLANGGHRPRPDGRAGRGRERRRRLPRRRARRRPQRPSTRAVPDAGLGERGGARRRADESRPLRRARRRRLRGRVGRDRRAGARRQRTSPDEGVDELRRYFEGGRTVAALGSSGAGKSSLANRLAGEELAATGDVRADGRGRHTTTARQLLVLPGGGLFLDTPGMRELRLWESEDGLETTFDDVASVAARLPVRRLRTRGRARLRGPGRARRRVARPRALRRLAQAPG